MRAWFFHVAPLGIWACSRIAPRIARVVVENAIVGVEVENIKVRWRGATGVAARRQDVSARDASMTAAASARKTSVYRTAKANQR